MSVESFKVVRLDNERAKRDLFTAHLGGSITEGGEHGMQYFALYQQLPAVLPLEIYVRRRCLYTYRHGVSLGQAAGAEVTMPLDSKSWTTWKVFFFPMVLI